MNRKQQKRKQNQRKFVNNIKNEQVEPEKEKIKMSIFKNIKERITARIGKIRNWLKKTEEVTNAEHYGLAFGVGAAIGALIPLVLGFIWRGQLINKYSMFALKSITEVRKLDAALKAIDDFFVVNDKAFEAYASFMKARNV